MQNDNNLTVTVHATRPVNIRYSRTLDSGYSQFAVIKIGEADLLVGLEYIPALRRAVDEAETALRAFAAPDPRDEEEAVMDRAAGMQVPAYISGPEGA